MAAHPNTLSGPSQFRDWMARRGFNQSDAATHLGFGEPYLSQLLSAERFPGLTNAIHIERMTGISVEAWASQLAEDARRQPAMAGKRRVAKE